MLVFTYIICP